MPAVRFPNFFFLCCNGPYAGFIYLELAGNRSCRPQSTVCIKHFNLSLQCHALPPLLRNISSIARGTLYGPHGVIAGLQ